MDEALRDIDNLDRKTDWFECNLQPWRGPVDPALGVFEWTQHENKKNLPVVEVKK